MFTLVKFMIHNGERECEEYRLVEHENGNELDAICELYKKCYAKSYTYEETLTLELIPDKYYPISLVIHNSMRRIFKDEQEAFTWLENNGYIKRISNT